MTIYKTKYQKRGDSSTINKEMSNIVKEIASVIGYENTMLLKNWKKAFPEQYVHMLSFDNMKKNKDGTTILYIKATNPSIGFLLHYEKLTIIEKLARIVGSKMIKDFKISAK